MLGKLVKKVVGSRNQRLLKQKNKIVAAINALEADLEVLSDTDLRAKTDSFRSRLEKGETLEQLLPEAFAVVREAAKRVLGMRHFDVQLVGGMVLHDGKIAEMRTGEGKTLVATLAAYLNALPGKGVHVVTVNDYLAQRDAAWMGKVYEFLGMSTGVIISDLPPNERQQGYQADITYGTNNEFGFDYLRDNMAFSLEQRVQRQQAYAIIDEVDSILIDEARTPLIISGPTDDHSGYYQKINLLIPALKKQDEEEGPGDFSVDEKGKQVLLTESGHEHVEQLMVEHGLMSEGESLYEAANIRLMHYANAALRATVLYQKDVDYIIKNNEIVIVDEFTGRTMTGRRWSDGLHQAVEAKEGVPIQSENQTLASITFQNYFRLYEKLSGMTGTADTEAFELQQIYGLEVVVIPTHHPMVRGDQGDLVYLSIAEKYEAIKGDLEACVERGQPVLVGTASVESSEYLASLLTKAKVPHEILNAKQHEREAHIIAQAGKPGAVTIATNMAGRGTDIVLGGNLEEEIKASGATDEGAFEQLRQAWKSRHQQVLDSGGLHVIGTERHESRRVDNQLRGRSGRQGDPGSTRFYLSLEDNLMRIFASDRVSGLMKKLGMEKGESIEHPWVTKAIANAQRKVEAYNFDIRKQLLEFDNVANDQRKVVYEQRSEIMEAEDLSEIITDIRHDVVTEMIDLQIPPGSFEEQWDVPALEENMTSEMAVTTGLQSLLDQDDSLTEESLRKQIHETVETHYQEKEVVVGAEVLRHFEKSVMLQVLDNTWKEHLAAMDYLRQGIHLRGYAQKDPKQEYKREAFGMFSDMLGNIKTEVTTILSKVQVNSEEDVDAVDEQRRSTAEVEYQHANAESIPAGNEQTEPELTGGNQSNEREPAATQPPFVREGQKIGRNEPCPCGSGQKYKACHGRLS